MNTFRKLGLGATLVAYTAMQVASACTGITLRTADGSVVSGRTVEFGVFIDTTIVVVPRGYAFTGKTPAGDGLKYKAKYAAVGGITFEDLALMDGMNEKGLTVGGFYFPTFAQYTPVTAQNQARGLSPTDFPNWLLTQFATVDEVRAAIEGDAIVITPTVLPGWGPESPPFHWSVTDKSGKGLVIEPLDGKLVLYDNPLGAITNSPTFDWHMTNLRNYIALDPRNVAPVTINGQTFRKFGEGNGMLGLPGDFSPPSRFVRAVVYSATATPSADSPKGVEQVFHILNNFDIPVGVAREEHDGVTHTDYTMLTIARDPQTLKYYFKSYDDQTIRVVDLNRFDLDAKQVKKLNTRSEQPIVEMSAKLK